MNRIFKSDSFKIVVVICVAMSLAAGFAMWGRDGLGIEIEESGPPVFRMYTEKQIEQARRRHGGLAEVKTNASTGCVAARLWPSRIGPSPEKIEEVILRTANGETENPSISTPLMAAVALNDYDEVERLIESGVDVNEANEESCTALMWAAMRGNKAILDKLLDAGADVDRADAVGTTALIIASHTNSVPAVKTLVEAGADINGYIVGGPFPERIYGSGATALIKAIVNERFNVVEYLVSAGADVNQADYVGMTALIHASAHKPLSIIKLLVDAGANVNAAQSKNAALSAADGTALIQAATFNQPEVVTYLLEAGADINHTDAYGRTALIGASQSNPANVKILVEAGADIDAAQTQNGGGGTAGDTALMNAVIYGQTETIKYLLSIGADPHKTNYKGQNAYQIALERQNTEAAVLLGGR